MSNSSADYSLSPASPRLLLTLSIPSFLSKSKDDEKLLPCVPSWNEVLGMEHWGRDKRKKEIQAAFLSALRACAAASLTRTTSAKNTWSIAADTLASYQAMVRDKRALKQRSARLEKKKLSAQSLKSSPFPEPPILRPAQEEIEPPPF